MDLIQAIVLGLVQGLTEFLPISSSGHVLLLPVAFGWEDPGAGFTAVIQLGTVLAVLIYFWKDLVRAFVGWGRSFVDKAARGTSDARLGWAVFVGTIPVVIVGLALEEEIDTAFRSPLLAALMLVGLGLLMGAADMLGKRIRDLGSANLRDGVYVGLWQCLALVPGSSRSGCTITGALFLGMDRATAARFSFLLSVPSVLGSGAYKLFKEWDHLMQEELGATIVATGVAFVSGLAAIAFLIRFLERHTTLVFVLYRLALGGLILALVMTGTMR